VTTARPGPGSRVRQRLLTTPWEGCLRWENAEICDVGEEVSKHLTECGDDGAMGMQVTTRSWPGRDATVPIMESMCAPLSNKMR
jgi:hypothetical protein